MHSDELHPLLDTTKNEQETLVTSFGSLRLHEDVGHNYYQRVSLRRLYSSIIHRGQSDSMGQPVALNGYAFDSTANKLSKYERILDNWIERRHYRYYRTNTGAIQKRRPWLLGFKCFISPSVQRYLRASSHQYLFSGSD